MTKKRYHNSANPKKVLFTGKDRRRCLYFVKRADKILTENTGPLGGNTNFRAYKESDVYHLIIDNEKDIRFTIDFEPIDWATALPEALVDSDLVIYCSRFEEPQGDKYDLLTDEIEQALMEFLHRSLPFIIIIENSDAIFEKDIRAFNWPERHLYLMKSLYGTELLSDDMIRDGGRHVLDSLTALIEYYSKGGVLFQPVEIFNFTNTTDEIGQNEEHGAEWLLQFLYRLLGLDKTYRYKYLTFNQLYG